MIQRAAPLTLADWPESQERSQQEFQRGLQELALVLARLQVPGPEQQGLASPPQVRELVSRRGRGPGWSQALREQEWSLEPEWLQERRGSGLVLPLALAWSRRQEPEQQGWSLRQVLALVRPAWWWWQQPELGSAPRGREQRVLRQQAWHHRRFSPACHRTAGG